MSNKGWKPGYTVGTSEGRWSPVNDDKRMRYEKANPQHYETPATEAYINAPIWKTCGECGKTFLGEDSLRAHIASVTHRAPHLPTCLPAQDGGCDKRCDALEPPKAGAYYALMEALDTMTPEKREEIRKQFADMGIEVPEASCPTPSTSS